MSSILPKLIQDDQWLQPFTGFIQHWIELAEKKEKELIGKGSLDDFASGYLYFGLHKTETGWVIREWLPNATHIFLIGTFNNWQEEKQYEFKPLGNGVWELQLEKTALTHGDLYALNVHWAVNFGKRIPAWATRVVQDSETNIFNAQVWAPDKFYEWNYPEFKKAEEPPLIYEAHIGMAGEEERVHTYNEFREKMLPRIKANGYNTVQLMAIPEHPYYGSFGYHVSSFFAASSRFGTPFELKQLIDEAHGMGMAVIMDLVHSHAVKNEIEGLGKYDGTRFQFFHDGPKGEHPAWDSYCFNYSKNEVLHFLLSNIKYWLEEYKFDGFRFDGVTSMLYFDHGLEKAFTNYHDYFGSNTDLEATTYFRLANKLIKQVKPDSIAIAEDVSGMPGLAVPVESGGLGFDYRMAMGMPDFWIKIIKEKSDDEWDVGDIFHQLTSKRMDEKVVSYAESHDQALVGDKTIIFRLIDKEMYFSMRKDQPNMIVDRGITLHKMIRLATATTAGGAYLNFMGNEFGHPEWIDFPREGNGWSYKHCRRIWSIAEDSELKFHWLYDFDKEMIQLISKNKLLTIPEVNMVMENKPDKVFAFHRGLFLFVFNFNPSQSFTDFGIPLGPGKYKIVLNTDSGRFGGNDLVDEDISYYTLPSGGITSQHYLKLYLPARTALVLKKIDFPKIK
ncbi:alpha amylase C-terminal domain-containing protein [Maribellus maritimus]|uniref:alpha amylase C-terminal domain-containing protein n=1 Tax=Maribellus maritimus TaxID=2870838 RepID=UPI001EEB60FD|nr:alpha amylase C-terminal domain-containing protein [Maribellus maritimus]MCG6187423.1 alpha amylase C-terminal domain-containing protein [Maribellus maritimus]